MNIECNLWIGDLIRVTGGRTGAKQHAPDTKVIGGITIDKKLKFSNQKSNLTKVMD